MARASATKSSPKKRSAKKQDTAKGIRSAHRELARAERRETELAKTLKNQAKAIKATEKQSIALRKTLTAATKALKSAVTSRKQVARQLQKLESGGTATAKRPAGR